jgi:hypothetical protein
LLFAPYGGIPRQQPKVNLSSDYYFWTFVVLLMFALVCQSVNLSMSARQENRMKKKTFKRSKFARQKTVLAWAVSDRRGGYGRGNRCVSFESKKLNRISRRQSRLDLRNY